MFNSFFSSFQDTALKTGCIFLIIICFAAIIVDIIFCISKIKITSFAVIVSTLLGCLITLPLSASFDKLIHISSEQQIERKEDVERQNGKLSVELQKMHIENEQLKNQISNLKCSQISALQFEKIAELAVLKANIMQTKVYDEGITEIQTGLGINANYYYDQLLLVVNHDIEAKFGIDMKSIKIKKINEHTISISGIKPVYIGASKNITNMPIGEIRRVNKDKDNHIKSVEVKTDKNSLQDVNRIADSKNKEYQSSLVDMKNFEFLQDAVETLSKNFLKIVFAPCYEDIIFDEANTSGAIPFDKYIKTEIEHLESRIVSE